MHVAGGEELRRTLARIDGRGYKAYQDLRGEYQLGVWRIEIAHVQGDPYAPPSRLHARVALGDAGLERFAQGAPPRLRALEDFLARRLAGEIRCRSLRDYSVDRCGQEVLLRTIVRVRPGEALGLEARLAVELPAAGRRIRARAAAQLLLEELPALLDSALTLPGLTLPGPTLPAPSPRSGVTSAHALEPHAFDPGALEHHQDVIEDHAALTGLLAEHGWVAFIANGAILPRRGGHDDRPLEGTIFPSDPPVGDSARGDEPSAEADRAPVIAFRAPVSLEREVRLPHAGLVRGMAIPTGVTLLVGGGFHGKSTLLEAIARGIYPHIPGDGREQVATDPLAVKIRAEDGRAVTGTDISPFIGDLPFGRATRRFSTQNASGSTSQAANIIEALEAGARALLVDEDTSATNFMIRDEPMRRLLKPAQEPITPFLDRVRNLHCDRGVSTVMVVGGSGEYFRVSDRVIQMDRYRPVDVTPDAHAIAPPGPASPDPFPEAGVPRRLIFEHYRAAAGPRGLRIKAQGAARILVDREEVDLGACEQIISAAQVRALAEILEQALENAGRDGMWREAATGLTAADVRRVLRDGGDEVLDRSSRFPRGDLAAVRDIEVMFMLNRLRDLVVRTD